MTPIFYHNTTPQHYYPSKALNIFLSHSCNKRCCMIQLVLFKSNGGKNMKVLIADDEQDMLRILKAYFEKEGFEVLLAKRRRGSTSNIL